MSDHPDPRAPWQNAEGRYGRPQAFRIGQRVRFRRGADAPAWTIVWVGIDLVIAGVFAADGGGVKYEAAHPGNPRCLVYEVSEEWLEAAPDD